MRFNDNLHNAARIASKLFNDGLTVDAYSKAAAYSILDNTVYPSFCKKVLDENESLVLAKMQEFEKNLNNPSPYRRQKTLL